MFLPEDAFVVSAGSAEEAEGRRGADNGSLRGCRAHHSVAGLSSRQARHWGDL